MERKDRFHPFSKEVSSMAEPVIPGPVSEDTPIREATCIHTRKIYDSCQSKDCLEDLRFYPTAASQSVLDGAQTVKSARAELLYVSVQVDPVGFHRGFYTVDLRYYYRVTAEAASGNCCRATPICGLVYYDKRCILYGSQGMAKTFTSARPCPGPDLGFGDNLPTAFVEAVDPVVLSLKLTEHCCPAGCECNCDCPAGSDVPAAILAAFDDCISFGDNGQRRLLISLGQFSILRMERDSQLLIPVYDYCMPHKECQCDGPKEDDPCQLFQQLDFPVGEFFPPAAPQEASLTDRLDACGHCRT